MPGEQNQFFFHDTEICRTVSADFLEESSAIEPFGGAQSMVCFPPFWRPA